MSACVNDSVHWYMSELTSRVVAESGTPGDRFHLGKIMMQCMKDDPDLVLQTDGATGESETSGSVLSRSVRCANSLRNLGLQTGDVMVLMAPNHIDLAIPFYAALFNGIIIAAVDRTLGSVVVSQHTGCNSTLYGNADALRQILTSSRVTRRIDQTLRYFLKVGQPGYSRDPRFQLQGEQISELQSTFSVDQPKIIFCQSEKAPDIQLALNELELNAQIIIFDRGDYLLNFNDFMDQYDDGTAVEDFKCADFDTEESVAFLIATSGTTGLPKAAAVTHKNIATTTPYLWSMSRTFPGPTRLCLVGSPLQWLTAIMSYVTATILRYPRLISSETLTQHYAYDLINTYKPSFAIFSPTMMTTLLKPGDRDECDFTCFDLIMLGGSAVSGDLIDEIQTVTPNTEVKNAYGMSELTNIAFHADNAPRESCGKPMGCLQYRLIDIETMQDIEEPNTPGELWLKGPGIFKEYYNNPEATEETFAEDRWFKTGDMFYRDENYNYFFVERIKLLLKYMSYQISPVELEAVIRQHRGVLDVAVTGVPDAARGDLPVACVVPAPGTPPTAQEIKDLVRDTLSDAKQLRGGVIFLSALPLTASTKVHRRKLKEMALTMERE